MVKKLLLLAIAGLLAACAATDYSVLNNRSGTKQDKLRAFQSQLGPVSMRFVSDSSNSLYKTLARRIGRLDIVARDRDTGISYDSTCTATLLDRNHIMTAGHCFLDEVTDAAVLLNFTSTDIGRATQVGVQLPPLELQIPPTNSEEVRSGLDYAILRLDRPVAYGVPRLPVRSIIPQEELFILGHPEGGRLRVSDEACESFPSSKLETFQFPHYCDTLKGHSGSLIFAKRDGAVVGIHSEGVRHYNPIEVANIGIRMSSILQDSLFLQRESRAFELTSASGTLRSVAGATAADVQAIEARRFAFVDGAWSPNGEPPIPEAIDMGRKYCSDTIGAGCGRHGDWRQVAPRGHDARSLGVIVCGNDGSAYRLTANNENNFEFYRFERPKSFTNLILQFQTDEFARRLSGFDRTRYGDLLLELVSEDC